MGSLLTATFRLQIWPPIVTRMDEPREYASAAGDFGVVLTIAPDEGHRGKHQSEKLWTYTCSELSLAVSRMEATTVPEVIETPGSRDFHLRADFFRKILPEYQKVALDALNGVLNALRWDFRQGWIKTLGEHHPFLTNPIWTDERGEEINPGLHGFVSQAKPGSRGEFGTVKLEKRHDDKLKRSLRNTKPADLHIQLLADAQAAAVEGNVRRAVLEMAIACEVFVKQAFLRLDNRSGLVFEALEDKGKIDVRVLDLIDIAGNALFGESFKKSNPDAYKDIDHLFRARNKIAHRGRAMFRDDGGEHEVDLATLQGWWESLDVLFRWSRGS